jgi:hypothetical protein
MWRGGIMQRRKHEEKVGTTPWGTYHSVLLPMAKRRHASPAVGQQHQHNPETKRPLQGSPLA